MDVGLAVKVHNVLHTGEQSLLSLTALFLFFSCLSVLKKFTKDFHLAAVVEFSTWQASFQKYQRTQGSYIQKPTWAMQHCHAAMLLTLTTLSSSLCVWN